MYYEALHHQHVMKKENSTVTEHLELHWWWSAAVAFYVNSDAQLHRDLNFKILYLWNNVWQECAFLLHPTCSVQNIIKHTQRHAYNISTVSLQSMKSHPF